MPTSGGTPAQPNFVRLAIMTASRLVIFTRLTPSRSVGLSYPAEDRSNGETRYTDKPSFPINLQSDLGTSLSCITQISYTNRT